MKHKTTAGWDIIKGNYINQLAWHKTTFSTEQFDKHWLEWVNQAFEMLHKFTREELVKEIEEWAKSKKTTEEKFAKSINSTLENISVEDYKMVHDYVSGNNHLAENLITYLSKLTEYKK